MTFQFLETHQSFGGIQHVCSHWSDSTNSEMRFAVYLPPLAEQTVVPVVYWLSGLTCSEQNFITKAGAQAMASQLGLAMVIPDTSPRGLTMPVNSEGLGEGAGFYLDATQTPWVKHYQMYTYVSAELPKLIEHYFPVDKYRCGIFGHSMGGHGALVTGLRNPHKFKSLSAFAPIASAMSSAWGVNALSAYLGEHHKTWQTYDACHLLKKLGWPHGEILVDQGGADPFLDNQLKPDLLVEACLQAEVSLNLRKQAKYDHSYYFIASFINDHLCFHAEKLRSYP